MNTSAIKVGSHAGPAETVLVVDDDQDLLSLEARALSKIGYRVLKAPGPVEALRLAAATPAIDLLLTDFDMPDANGLELARRFRAVHPAAPVLLVSGSLQEVEVQREGLDRLSFLAKPFSWEQLVDKVGDLLASQKPLPSMTGSGGAHSGAPPLNAMTEDMLKSRAASINLRGPLPPAAEGRVLPDARTSRSHPLSCAFLHEHYVPIHIVNSIPDMVKFT